jgi:hypothetical protein
VVVPIAQPSLSAGVPDAQTTALPSISPGIMIMDQVPPLRAHDTVAEELAAGSLAFYWQKQITLAEAEIDFGQHRLSVATRNYIIALERLIPFRRPSGGEPRAGASGSGVGDATTSDDDDDPIPPLGESDDEPMFSDFKEPEDVGESGNV